MSTLRVVIVKVGTFASLFLIGDVTSQKIVQYQKTKKIDRRVDSRNLLFTGMWASLVGGPIVYKWYKYLDGENGFKKSWIGKKISIGPISGTMRLPRGLIFGKIIADLLFDIPFYGFYFYAQKVQEEWKRNSITKNVLFEELKRNSTKNGLFEELKRNSTKNVLFEPFRRDYFSQFVKIYKTDVYFWTPTNFINFFLIPERFRILYVSVATAGWACLLPILARNNHTH